MLNTKKLTSAIQVALFIGTASLVAGNAFAQTQTEEKKEETKSLDRVEVVGSRVKRAEIEGALPVTVIDRAGGHLGDAWHWERERHLLWPWLPPSAAVRRLVDAPDPARVHANVVELLRLGPRLAPLLAATTPPDLAGQLRALDLALSVSAEPANDYQGRAAALLS